MYKQFSNPALSLTWEDKRNNDELSLELWLEFGQAVRISTVGWEERKKKEGKGRKEERKEGMKEGRKGRKEGIKELRR